MGITEQIIHSRERYDDLTQKMTLPEYMSDPKRMAELAKTRRQIEPLVEKGGEYLDVCRKIDETAAMLEEEKHEEMRQLAQAELDELKIRRGKLDEEIRLLLIPKNPFDEKDIIMEIRAGTGGDEAGLFAGDLFRMYTRYAERKRWKLELIDQSPQGIGGFKEVIFSIHGENVYSNLQFEKGVHRVQRIPVTESGGRIHTSAASVAVLPEAEETEFEINPNELRIDVFRSSGHGGQSVNTTDSAVRVTHIPTGLIVSCQDEKSQHKNKAKALRVLRARLMEIEEEKRQKEIANDRKTQVGSGDRSERIRTYNFPQNRCTDHRIGLTLYKLDKIMDGEISELIDALIADHNHRLLENMKAS